MSEEIDYAEMLEIPVATVNVVKKKRRRFPDLKAQAVGKVNERMESRAHARDKTYAGNEAAEEPDIVPETQAAGDAPPPEGSGTETALSPYEEPRRRTHPVLIVEFALACALCLTIFLTNVFMPESAINTFIRGVLSPDTDAAASRTYADFTLSGVVSEFADVELTVSSAGVLSFTGECSVYPACDGTVESVTQNGDTYTAVVAHSDTFESVYTGLSTVYYAAGDAVLSKVPFAYTDGANAVQVTFYQDGEVLNCYSVDAENCLSWNE